MATLVDSAGEEASQPPDDFLRRLISGGWRVLRDEQIEEQDAVLLELVHPSAPLFVEVLFLAVSRFAETSSDAARRIIAEKAIKHGPGAAIGYLQMLRSKDPSAGLRAGFALGLSFQGQTLSATGSIDEMSDILLSEITVLRDRAVRFGSSEPKTSSADGGDAKPAPCLVADDLPAVSDGLPAKPGLGFDRIAAAIVKLVDGVVDEARDREARDESLITVGIYGLWGSGKSTLMRAIRGALPAKRYLSISVNPWKIAEKESLYDYFRDRTLDQLAPFFLGIRSRRVIRGLLWLSNYPWLWGSALLGLLFLVAILSDPAVSWKMIGDVFNAWWTAKPGEGWNAVDYIMQWYPVTTLVQALPLLAVALPLIAKFMPKLLQSINARLQLIGGTDTSQNLQSLYCDLAALAKSENRTLAFFVDDLDRCTPARVAEFVESVHSLTAAGCVVFVACDDEYVSAALNAKYREIVAQHRDGKGFGRGFLAKIVQVPFRVPMVDEAGARSVVFPSRHTPVPGGEAAPVVATGPSPIPATGPAAPPPPEVKLEEAQLSAILDDTVGAFVRPLGLNIRFLKSLVGTIKLQLDIGGFASEAEARRLAAAVFADSVDPAWLDAHALRQEAPHESVLALHSDLVDRLHQAIGDDEGELRRIYQRLGRRPRFIGRAPDAAAVPASRGGSG